jgi:hypothetical protein
MRASLAAAVRAIGCRVAHVAQTHTETAGLDFRPTATATRVSSSRTVPSRRGRRWDEESIRAALTEFLDGWEVWPTCEEFIQGGAKGLREAVARVGGAEWWASEMALPGGDRSVGGVRHWTDETIRATLTDFLGDRPDWPTQREFNEAGLHPLSEVLRFHGGGERWAREMGVARHFDEPRQLRGSGRAKPKRAPTRVRSREWPKWTEQTITAELELFLRGRKEWPRYTEFVESGRKGLYQALLTHGGTHEWARRMGVQWVTYRGGTPRYWTEGRVREQLAAFLEHRRHWPTDSEFNDAGERRLARAVRRTGGAKYWAREFGLVKTVSPRPPKVPRASRAKRAPDSRKAGASSGAKRPWDDERIAAAISPLTKELGRWPTKSEFRRAGLGSALSAVYDHGGSALWQTRLDVAPLVFDGPLPDRTRWTERRVKSELSKFCKGRDTWPTQREFKAAGASALYHAASTRGGINLWRSRLGL